MDPWSLDRVVLAALGRGVHRLSAARRVWSHRWFMGVPCFMQVPSHVFFNLSEAVRRAGVSECKPECTCGARGEVMFSTDLAVVERIQLPGVHVTYSNILYYYTL